MAGLVDPEPVHAVERRTRDELGDLPSRRYCLADALVVAEDRSDDGCAGEPVLHGETSRFWKVFARHAALANET